MPVLDGFVPVSHGSGRCCLAVSEAIPANSQVVGAWTLLWRICSFVFKSSGEPSRQASLSPDSETSPPSSFSQGIGPRPITEMLVVRPILSTSRARRWLLISGSVPLLDVSQEISKSGRSLVVCGD